MKIVSYWFWERAIWNEKSEKFENHTTTEEVVKELDMKIIRDPYNKKPVIKFIGGPTGHENYYVEDLLSSNDRHLARFCICAGTVNMWPTCFVDRKQVIDFLKSGKDE